MSASKRNKTQLLSKQRRNLTNEISMIARGEITVSRRS